MANQLTLEQAKAIVLEKYPDARVTSLVWQFAIANGDESEILSTWVDEISEAWFSAAQRIQTDKSPTKEKE